MGESKPGSIESAILGIWEEAAELEEMSAADKAKKTAYQKSNPLDKYQDRSPMMKISKTGDKSAYHKRGGQGSLRRTDAATGVGHDKLGKKKSYGDMSPAEIKGRKAGLRKKLATSFTPEEIENIELMIDEAAQEIDERSAERTAAIDKARGGISGRQGGGASARVAARKSNLGVPGSEKMGPASDAAKSTGPYGASDQNVAGRHTSSRGDKKDRKSFIPHPDAGKRSGGKQSTDTMDRRKERIKAKLSNSFTPEEIENFEMIMNESVSTPEVEAIWQEAAKPERYKGPEESKPKTFTSPALRRKAAQDVQKADAAAVMARAKKGIRPKNLGISGGSRQAGYDDTVKKEQSETEHGSGENAFEVGTDRYANYTNSITPGQQVEESFQNLNETSDWIFEQIEGMSDEEFDILIEEADELELEGLLGAIGRGVMNVAKYGTTASRLKRAKKKGEKIGAKIDLAKQKSANIAKKQDLTKARKQYKQDNPGVIRKAAGAIKSRIKKSAEEYELSGQEQLKGLRETVLDMWKEAADTHVDPKDRDELDKEVDGRGGAETAKRMKHAAEPKPMIKSEALTAKQKQLDIDDDGEIEASDLEKLRKKEDASKILAGPHKGKRGAGLTFPKIKKVEAKDVSEDPAHYARIAQANKERQAGRDAADPGGAAKRAKAKKKIAARPAVKPSDVGRSGQYNEYDPAVDEELTIPQAQEFKVASMKQALAQVWGLDEWKNTKEDHQEKKKGGKTDTGGKMAEVEIDPELKDKK